MAEKRKLTLSVLPRAFAIARLGAEEEVPGWTLSGPFASVTRTEDEISVVCAEEAVPAGILHEGGWRCLGVAEQLDFSLAGVIASLAEPLATAGVPIFLISTYDSDYLLVKDDRLERAREALVAAGHHILD